MSAAQVEIRAPPSSSIGGLENRAPARVLLRRRPDQHDQAAQQDAERHGGEDGGQHHLAGHLAHQKDVDQTPTTRLRITAAAIAMIGWPTNSEALVKSR